MASKKTQKPKMAHIKNPSGFDVGLMGLAVMGQNLARNIADKGISISVFNRTTEKTVEFVEKYGITQKREVLKNDSIQGNKELTTEAYAAIRRGGSDDVDAEVNVSQHFPDKIFGTKTIAEFTKSLKTPRKIILMVKAGEAVDQVIEELLPHLTKGDIIMDGGNSYYKDTQTRQETLSKKGIHFIGMGISGGEEGALKGPSIMPGGDLKAYRQIKNILEKIAAKEILPPAKFPFRKCVTYIGNGSAGHFVKMVHNGIEYAIMQAIAETYDVLKKLGKFSNKKLSETFSQWNKTENLNSFLIEITAKIFLKKDKKSHRDLIDLIQDQSQQKGTGKWTAIAGFDYGRPVPGISSAVEARSLSAHPARGKILFHEALNKKIKIPSQKEIKSLAQSALELTTILSYLQGFELLKTADSEEKWGLNLPEIARIWKNGCIIRSSLLEKFQQKAYFLKQLAGDKQKHWRKFISIATSNGIPIPTIQATLAYYDTLRAKRLPQNLTQAMRDFFGAHGYAKIGQEGTFHTDWQ